jgi:signal transduction histidine kinase
MPMSQPAMLSENATRIDAAAVASKPRLYLADDSRSMRNYYRLILVGHYDVTVFDDGEPLFAAAQQAAPDLIVSDVNMPGMGGRELVALLKQHPDLRPVPVILLTAKESGEEEDLGGSVECLDAGADDYLQKPFRPEELLARTRSASRSFDLFKQIRRKHEELAAAYQRLAKMEIDLRQAQKLEAVGRLAAGVAHEINTPVQYISDNVTFASEAFRELGGLCGRYRAAVAATAPAELQAELASAEQASDLDFLLSQTPQSFATALAGLARIASIVSAMKDIGREDADTWVPADVNKILQSTLDVARGEYQSVADVETDWGAKAQVLCRPSALGQVFLHVLTNAAHAIADACAGGGARRGTIRVSTRDDRDSVLVTLADTGTGIAPEIRERVFDPFFTTKEVGRGSGQGLTVAHSIVEKHGGTIHFETAVGKGTSFIVRVPVNGPERAAESSAKGSAGGQHEG